MPLTICWLLVVVLGVRLSLSRQIKRWSSPYLLLAFFFLVGGLHGTIKTQPPQAQQHIRQLIQQRQDASIIGVVLRSPEITQKKTTLLVDSSEIILPKNTSTTSGLIRLTINGAIAPNIQPGDSIICRARLAPVSSYGVPGTFDYKKYMAQQSVWITGWAKSPVLIKKIPPPQRTVWQRLRYLPERIRHTINRFLDTTLSADQAGVYKAILTGDRSGLSSEIKESFKASGATHLLAISGIHIGLLALISTAFFNFLLKRSEKILLHYPALKISALLSLLPLTAYATIAGFAPPVLRALLMAIVFIGAFVCNRQWSFANNIAIAALIILAWNPGMLGSASFQLSFSAVMTIALFSPLLQKIIASPKATGKARRKTIRQTLCRWLSASLLISVIASAGTAPILLTHFNRLSLLSPITTLLIEPILCVWSLMTGLLGTVLLPLPAVAALFFRAGAVGIDLTINIITALAKLPFASFWSPAPHLIQTFAWYVLLGCLALYQSKRFKRLQFCGLLTGLAGLTLPFLGSMQPAHDILEVAVLDVGQGSAIIFHLPNGQTYLLDGGQKSYSTPKRFDIGEQIIAKYLWHKRITKLDGVIISHPDADHYNGLPFLLTQFKPTQLWINSAENAARRDDRQKNGYARLLDQAKQLGIPISVPKQGEDLCTGTSARLIALSASHTASKPPQKPSTNNDSLILRLEYGTKSFLFPSDIEKNGELAAIEQTPDLLDSNVLIAPHHGSKTSSSPNFLATVAPQVIVVSAGKNASGTFPSTQNLTAYKKIGSKVYLTADSGTVFFATDGKELTVRTFFGPNR